MNFFYCSDLNSDTILLRDGEFAHASKSLRLSIGDHLYLVNGMGRMVKAQISVLDKKVATCQVLEVHDSYNQLPYHLTLGVAPTKNLSRYEWMIEKTTEIGVSSIIPIVCQHSERRHLRLDRLDKVAIAAMKQSLKARKPKIEDTMDFSQTLKEAQGQKFICIGSGEKHLADVYSGDKEITVLIGPEGDFADHELNLALDAGFIPVNLGKQRLRTETAAIVTCSTIALAHK